MGADHNINIIGDKADRLQRAEDVIVACHDRDMNFVSGPHRCLGFSATKWMASDVKQHVSLRTPKQRARDRQLDHLAAIRIRNTTRHRNSPSPLKGRLFGRKWTSSRVNDLLTNAA